MSVQGTLRSDRRLAMLLRRLQPGDIAVIDATDMDQATAEALANRGVVAVVNAAPCLSGRFPAQGPGVLLDAGIGLIDSAVDAVGADLGQGIGRGAIKDGGTATIVDGELSVRGRPVATGRVVTQTVLTDLLDASRDGLETQLQTFTHNSIEYLRREQGLLLHGQGIPELHTRFEGQGAVVVAADYDYRAELKRLRRYLRDQRPVMVGIDAGADALIESGFTPDLVVLGAAAFTPERVSASGADPVSDKAIKSAKEVLLHADESGRLIGADRVERLGARPSMIAAAGATRDVALLVADSAGAATITTVGLHTSLDELLDRQRGGEASTFLTHLRVGPKLVDSRSIPYLYAGGVRRWQLLLVLLAGLIAVVAAIATTSAGQEWWDSLRSWIDKL